MGIPFAAAGEGKIRSHWAGMGAKARGKRGFFGGEEKWMRSNKRRSRPGGRCWEKVSFLRKKTRMVAEVRIKTRTGRCDGGLGLGEHFLQ